MAGLLPVWLLPVSLPMSLQRNFILQLHFTRGFTLIEIIVVVFVIGVIVTFASLSVNQHGERYIEDEARRLHHLLRLATEEAVLTSQELSLMVTRQGYNFARLEGPKWAPLADDPLFRARELPETIKVELLIDGQKADLSDSDKPVQIYLLSSGEVTPFEIRFSGESEESYSVTGSLTGQIAYKPPESNDGLS